MNRLQIHLRRVSTVAVASLMVTSAVAGPDYVEPPGMDAGSLPASAQGTGGFGTLRMIKGNLGVSAEAPGDFEDMFIIRIVDHVNFCARTVLVTDHVDCCSSMDPINPTSSTNFNTQLFLFALDQKGVVANDDENVSSQLSKIVRIPTDGSPILLNTNGVYFIAVSGGPQRDPVDGFGQLIFNQVSTTEVSGPDGPGGLAGNPVGGWVGSGATNVHYEISLCGCEFAPSIPTLNEWGFMTLLAITAIAGAAMVVRKQKAVFA